MRLVTSIILSLVLSLSCPGIGLLNPFILFPPTGGTAWVTDSSSGTLRNDFTGQVGTGFTVSSTITITELGIWVVSGSVSVVTVSLYSAAGYGISNTRTLLKSGTISTTGLPVGWNYVSITPQSVSSGTTYFVSRSVVSSGDQWYDQYTPTITSAATIVDSAYSNPVDNYFSKFGTSSGKMYGGVDFKY